MQITGLLHGARLQKALSEETALEPCRAGPSPEIIRLTKIGRRLVDCEPHEVTPKPLSMCRKSGSSSATPLTG